MCGRFTLRHTVDEIAERFAAEVVAEGATGSYNVAPTEQVAVVTQEGARRLDSYRWGLVPAWAKEIEIGSRMINARAETLGEKPAFRRLLTRRRCLIPGDGFYEWKQEGKAKQPMFIHRPDDDLFAFAGLWDEWHAPDGSPLRSCTIITVAPNSVVSPIHDRMPAILTRDAEAAWLDPSLTDAGALQSLLRPYPPDEMTAYPVGRQVNAPTFDDPSCIAPLAA